VGPYGQRTVLSVDPNGYLQTVTAPDGAQTVLGYKDDTGLLASYEDRTGAVTTFEYDSTGLLLNETDPRGGQQQLSSVEEDGLRTATFTDQEGRVTTYTHERTDEATERSAEQPWGGVATTTQSRTGETSLQLPDGSRVQTTLAPSPQFGLSAPRTSQRTTILPSGLRRVETFETEVQLDPDNLVGLLSRTDCMGINGRVSTTVFDVATRTYTQTTPAGRTTTQTVDSAGRPLTITRPGLLPQTLQYDANGRLVLSAAGTRVSNLSYFGTGDERNGYLAVMTDAAGVDTFREPDSFGRTLSSTTAGATTLFSWDGESNLTSVTPPGKPTHTQTYNSVHLPRSQGSCRRPSQRDDRELLHVRLNRHQRDHGSQQRCDLDFM
jgi:YD repeat-containing protein